MMAMDTDAGVNDFDLFSPSGSTAASLDLGLALSEMEEML
jgi:hypothetical protein